MKIILKFGLCALIVGCAAKDPLLGRVDRSRMVAGTLELNTLYAFPPFRDAPVPIYLHIVNMGDEADTLLSVSSPASTTAMVHGGDMEELAALPIPGNDSLVLQPGDLHLMLMPPTPAFERGDSLEVTFNFAGAGKIKATIPVISLVDADEVR